ncbi:MAG: hypothetical protein KBT88_12245 [Gammaproteobacteria bacterium]|nr:hypothetical protein [Gammaproteobacteria bacterium]MBQ0840546.1 hypothetical protein [Gammaproteobacteria bacterium]
MSFKKIASAAGLVLGALASTQSYAHHAFGAEFDAKSPLTLRGNVTRIEWVNPHAWFHIEVAKADGVKEAWRIEGGTPNTLLRRGINKRSIAIGTEIVVDGYWAKDRSNSANGRNITLANGKKMFMGSSGTGAPEDGADKK